MVQALALNDLGTHRGEEALTLVGVGRVEKVGDYTVENSVSQEFQSLVVHLVTVAGLHGIGAVSHRQLVQPDVAGIVASDTVNKNIKLFILDEKELYA